MFRFLILMRLFGGDRYKNRSLGSLTVGDVTDAYFGYLKNLFKGVLILFSFFAFVAAIIFFKDITAKHDEKAWAKEERAEAVKQAAIHAGEVKRTGNVPYYDYSEIQSDPYLWGIMYKYAKVVTYKELRLTRLHEIADKKIPMDKKTLDEMKLLEKQDQFDKDRKIEMMERYEFALFQGVGTAEQQAIWKSNLDALKKEYGTLIK